MKNFSTLVVMILTVSILSLSCGNKSSNYELALITDMGTIDDKSFNQGSWEGLKKYAEEKGISYKYYKPTAKDTDSKIDSILLAVAAGAKLVVTPGYLFEPAIYKAQDEYPEINFVILDGTPQDGTYTDFRIEKNVYSVLYAEEEAGFLFEPAIYKAQDEYPEVNFVILDGTPQDGTYTDFRIEKNVYSVLYAEEEAGFLAGYGIVKEGYTNLGVMGGMAEPAVIRFCYGFVQGANYAAKELGMRAGGIKVDYTYIGVYDPTPEVQTTAASWFINGVQVIFAPAGAAANSVMAAAEQNNGLVIGVDVDQSGDSPTVITSAMKMIGESVYNAIDDFYNGNFPGGQSVVLDAKVNGIGLPMETSRFKKFTQEDYNNIYQKLVDGSIKVLKDTDAKDASQLPLDIVRVNLIQ